MHLFWFLIFQVVDKQIVQCLDEMVVNILMCLYDSDDLDESIRNLDPKPNPPFYNSYNIKTTLDYLTKSFSGSGKSLVEILCKSPVSWCYLFALTIKIKSLINVFASLKQV